MRAIASNGFTEDEVLEVFYGPDVLFVFRFGLYSYDLVFQRYLDGIEGAKSVNDADAAINEIFSCKVDRDAAGEIDWLNCVIGPEVWIGMGRAGTDGDPYAKYLVNLYEPKTHPFKLDETSAFYDIQAYDLSQRLRDSELQEPWVIAAGVSYFDAISEILTVGGFGPGKQNIDVPAESLPEPRTWPIGDGVTLLKVLDDLLEGINCVRHPEPNGSYTVRPWQNPATAGAGFTYTVGARGVIYSERSVSQDSYEGYNKVTMTNTAPEREGLPWVATAENDDMTSPLYKGNRGGRIYNKTFTDVDAASFAVLQEKCTRQELEYRQRYITAELATRIAPWHGTREIVAIDDTPLLGGLVRFEEKHWELEYRADARMTHGFSNRPRSLSAVVNGGSGGPGGGGGTVRPGKRGIVVMYSKLARINPAWDGTGNPTVIFADDLDNGAVSGPFAFNQDLIDLAPGDWVKVDKVANTWIVAHRVTSA